MGTTERPDPMTGRADDGDAGDGDDSPADAPRHHRARKVGLVIGSIVLCVLALVAGTIVVFTNTDWGRQKVRGYALDALRKQAHGTVRMGAIRGNLLTGLTVDDFSITDSAGDPFVAVERLRLRYALRGILLGKRLIFTDVELVRPVIVLDRRPGEKWNYARIFPGDTTKKATPEDTTPGFGDWLALERVTMTDGRVLLRTPFTPNDSLTTAQQDSVIRRALAGDLRYQVVPVRGGQQKVSDFRSLTGFFPLLRLSDPSTDTRLIRVARLKGILAPFRPPEGAITDLAGDFEVTGDSLWFRGIRGAMPGSEVAVDGRWLLKTNELELRVRTPRASFADFRWAYPPFPAEGSGSLDFHMHWKEEPSSQRYQITNADVQVGRSALAGDLGFTLTDTVEFHQTNLVVGDFDTRLVEQLVPGLELPRNGRATGRLALDGGLLDLHLDTDLVFVDPISGTSHVAAKGVLGFGKQGLERAKDLQIRMMPAQVLLARAVLPDFPMAGTASGILTLDGTRERWFASSANVVLVDAGQRSHVIGRATMGFGPAPAEAMNYADVVIRAEPLALETTVGRFAPALGLRGAVTGPIRLTGPFERLQVDADLGLPAGGHLAAKGIVGFGAVPSYDMRVGMRTFDASALSSKVPATTLSLTATAVGRGSDPETLVSRVALAAEGSRYGEVRVDSARVSLAASGGVLTLDTLIVAGEGLRARAGGQFGLGVARTGTISYAVEVDSLRSLSRWLPRDSGVVAPRPLVTARAIARARSDSARIARATEVERAVTGGAAPTLVVDTPTVVRRDSVAGAVYLAGNASGTIRNFNMRGRGAVEGLVYGGNVVDAGRVEYAWTGAPKLDRGALVAAADLNGVRAAGFALEHAGLRLAHAPATQGGTAQVLLRQEEGKEYAAQAQYRFHAGHREAHFDDLRLRFDTTTWRSAGPSTVEWGEKGFTVDKFDIRNGATGRVFADGFIPRDQATPASLRAVITDFQVGDVLTLLQSDVNATARVSLGATFTGTLRDPRITGAIGATDPVYNGTPLPDLRARFEYANARFGALAEVLKDSRVLASADARLPVNLALGATGPRFDTKAPIAVDLVADSLPLESLPQFTDVVSNVRGRAVGRVEVRGTAAKPTLMGELSLALGGFRVVPTGMNVRNMTGRMRFTGDSVVVDSITGYARGPVSLEGGIGFANLSKPSFDLRIEAKNAEVMRNERGDARADISVSMYGPYERVYVNGQVRIREGVIYLPEGRSSVISAGDPALFNVADTAVASERALLPTSSPLMDGMRVNMQVAVDRDTWVRSKDANVEVYSDGWLQVAADRAKRALMVEGVMNSDRGEYTFLSKRFQIKRGSATFIGTTELNPTVQATAEYEVGVPGTQAMLIRLLIGGTVLAPRLTLESNAQPPVSQSDLLSYLAFGQSSSSLLQVSGSGLGGGGGGGNRLVGATAALATNQLAAVALGVAVSEVEGRAARSFGLDVFNITPAPVQTELLAGNVSAFAMATDFEAGRYWARSRWFTGLRAPLLAYVANPGGAAPPGLSVQYRTPQGFRVEASAAPRYLLQTPTLQAQPSGAISVLGLFLIREWRF